MIKYNLQFFAKEGSGGEKTEKPTEKRKEESRKEGQVAKSNEIGTAFLLIFAFLGLKIFSSFFYEKITNIFIVTYKTFSNKNNFGEIKFVHQLVSDMGKNILIISAPLLIIVFLVAIISNVIQVGWHPTAKPLKPKFNRLNPINGLKNLFSMRAVVELIKSILKIVIISVIIYQRISDEEEIILNLYDLSIYSIGKKMIDLTADIGIRVGIFFIIVAIIDYAYKKYDHLRNIKMTKQEIKEEYKMVEGNPEIKGKIKQKMREVSMKRMMQDLPQADVVITNPTHFAVAIKYDSNKSSAPMVLAKGADYIAAKIKKSAKENEIEIVENKPLARTLYYTVDIGDEIPPELYQAVAEVLAFVYNLKNNYNG